MFDNFCAALDAGLRCGGWAFLYLYQTAIAGILAVVAGAFAYGAGLHQARAARDAATRTITAMRETTAQTIAHERQLQENERRDRVEREINEAMNALHQLRFEVTQLRHSVNMAMGQLPQIVEAHANGMRAKAQHLERRVAAISRLIERGADIMKLPDEISGPVSRLFAWADDISSRCIGFADAIGADGRLGLDHWVTELRSVVTGIDELSEATAAFLEHRTEPRDAFVLYIDTYQAVHAGTR